MSARDLLKKVVLSFVKVLFHIHEAVVRVCLPFYNTLVNIVY